MQGGTKYPPGLQSTKDNFTFVTSNGQLKQRCCTYVSTSGNFSEQHWYNCYTCGLLWDKGCCSLCAQVCHKGHDVTYSRKSSFFCDCGAEVGTDCGRAACKCLSCLSDTVLSSIFNVKRQSALLIQSGSGNQDMHSTEISKFWAVATNIPATKFPSIFIASIDKFTGSLNNNILKKLFGVFNTNIEAWTDKRRINSTLLDDIPAVENDSVEGVNLISTRKISLLSRGGKQFEASPLLDKVFSPVRIFKSSTVNSKLSNEPSIERVKKSILSKNGIERNIVVSDQRGRIIIYEAESLTFCSGVSLANVRHQDALSENQLRRSDLCILGSSKVKCNIVGMVLPRW